MQILLTIAQRSDRQLVNTSFKRDGNNHEIWVGTQGFVMPKLFGDRPCKANAGFA
ncbi:hypothetical protein NBRC116601_23960 [Cognatishimia sp. WU-CL00825]